jgi:hypothetical protein
MFCWYHRITRDIAVLDDIVISDNRPIHISIECCLISPQYNFPQTFDGIAVFNVPLWSVCDLITKVRYQR